MNSVSPNEQDENTLAARQVSNVTGLEAPTGVYEALQKRRAARKAAEAAKNPAAVALGRLGGMKGGKARAESLTPEQRKAIASKAAKKRWETKSQEKV